MSSSASKQSQSAQNKDAVALCAYFGCDAKAAPGRRLCREHLDRMSEARRKSVQERRQQGRCIDCGERPQFWGLRCVICRQQRVKNADALPSGAARALRLYRDAQRRLAIEQFQTRARFEVRKLLATGDVRGPRAEALRLHTGADDCIWRTHAEVARLMDISRERVRQLLYPYKTILTATPTRRSVRGSAQENVI